MLAKTLNHFFQLSKNNTSIRTEVIAGFTTYLTMAYISVVNPAILSQAGINIGSAFMATCITAALGCFLCGVLANLPVAIAPSMGLNAYFTFVVVKGLGFTWQAALGAVFIAGLIFLLLTALKVRQWIINAIPHSLSLSIAAGIGLFIGFIAFKELGIIVPNPNTYVSLGNVLTPQVLLAFLGFALIVVFEYRKVPGAILLSVLLVSLIGFMLHLGHFHGVVSMPPSIKDTVFAFDIHTLIAEHAVRVIFTFVLVALFDSTGTILGLLHQAGFHRDEAKLRLVPRALAAEGIATVSGALLGTSTTSLYVESAAGIAAYGRTGLTAVVISLCFLGTLFFAPLAASIASYAYTPALLYVACKMAEQMANIDWHDVTESFPSILTMILIPLTFSIIDGIAIGFIFYVILKLVTRQFKQISPAMLLLAGVFIGYFALVS